MLIAFVLLYTLLANKETVERYIYAVIWWTLICYGMTEILSCFCAITTRNLWCCWLFLDIALLVLIFRKFPNRLSAKSVVSAGLKVFHKKEVILLAVFAIGLLFLAIRTVPYNWDSMTYHLSRLYHWKQNGSVAHYATSIDRQVASPVLGAFVNLHVYVMCGGSDIFINLLQAVSFLTNGILIYVIAKRLSCTPRYCVLATVLYYTTPIAFAEALTTQVDNFSTLWMLCFVYLLLEFLNLEKQIIWNRECLERVLALSVCIAFGYLTKPSVCISMVLFAFWLFLIVIKRKDKCLTIVSYLLVSGVLMVMLLLPELLRNISTFGAISSPGVGQRQLIGSLYYKNVLLNCLKNFTFNLPSVWIYGGTEMLWKFVVWVAQVGSIDINNPAIAEDGKEFYMHGPQTYGHDTAVNPIVVTLMIICVIFFVVRNRKWSVAKRQLGELRNQFFVVAVISFMAFCAVLRWEPFVSRYMISYFAILCPAISMQTELFFSERGNGNWDKGQSFLAIVYFVSIVELYGLICCHGKIAMGSDRPEGYFHNNTWIMEDYKAAANYVNENSNETVGLCLGGDTYEYPLLQLLDKELHIEHVNVSNYTKKYENADFCPDTIIVIDLENLDDTLDINGRTYTKKEIIGEKIRIYE